MTCSAIIRLAGAGIDSQSSCHPLEGAEPLLAGCQLWLVAGQGGFAATPRTHGGP